MGERISSTPTILVTTALCVIVVAGMRAAASIINPFLLAVFLSSLCAPLLDWLQRRRVPNGLAVSAIMLGLLVVALLLMAFVGRSLNILSQQVPAYQNRLSEIWNRVFVWLNGLGLDITKLVLADYVTPKNIMVLVSYGLSISRSIFSHMFLVLLTVFFILLEASGLPRKLQVALPDSAKTLDHFKTITTNVNRYMGIKALFSLATGVAIWGLLALIGVDFAGTWALLAFFLNFIPAIGSIIAAIPAILWALIQLGPPYALLTFLAYLCVNIIIGSLLEPKFLGRKLGLSTLVVFLSMLFWGWVLGPIGMLLSVPLTMIVKIALATSEDTRWIAVILE